MLSPKKVLITYHICIIERLNLYGYKNTITIQFTGSLVEFGQENEETFCLTSLHSQGSSA